MPLRFDDLFAYGFHALCHLRLYESSHGPIPWSHNPFKCAHLQHYEGVRALYDPSDGDQPAGAHFFLTLDAASFAGCPVYHSGDWAAIAAASVELLVRKPVGGDQVHAVAKELLGDGEDARLLELLFSDPIVWEPGSTRITSGQHRSCALKAAGAPLCAVAGGSGSVWHDAAPADARHRAQSTLTTYWARRLGD